MGMVIMNGVEYSSSPKDGFPPIIYSDEEREIGVWRDGKPLYQKTFVNTVSNFKTLTDIGATVDKIVSLDGTFTNGDWYQDIITVNDAFTQYIKIIAYPNNAESSSNKNKFKIIATNSSWDNATCFITLQYTKTADKAGSGKYTTYGGLSHHYSTTEQVVGTWIDGKPLYEKTFTGTLANANNTRITFETTWNVKNVYGNIKETNYNQKIGIGGYANESYYCEWVQGTSSYYINLYYSDNFKTNGYYEATIQYTKTTD